MFSIFRKKKSAAEEFGEQIAGESFDEASRRSEEVVSRMRDRLLDQGFVDTDLAAFVADKGSAFLLNIELQFLWGFFHEFVQTMRFPTNGYDRIKIYIIDRLMTVYGFSFEDARHEANRLEGFFNEDDRVFMVISDVGKKAFHEPDDDAMLRIISAYRQHV